MLQLPLDHHAVQIAELRECFSPGGETDLRHSASAQVVKDFSNGRDLAGQRQNRSAGRIDIDVTACQAQGASMGVGVRGQIAGQLEAGLGYGEALNLDV